MLAEKDGFPPFHCYSYICCYHSIRYVCLSPTSSSTAWPLRFTPFPRTHLSCRLHICVRQTHNHVQAKKWQLRKWPKIHILLMDLRAAPFRQSTARAHANGLNVGAAFFFFFFLAAMSGGIHNRPKCRLIAATRKIKAPPFFFSSEPFLPFSIQILSFFRS